MVAKINKEADKLWLRDVPHDKVFLFRDGRMVRNLDKLTTTLREKVEEMFKYLVAGDKDDFSNWVRDVIGDVTLANELQKATIQTTAAHRVDMRLNWLEARL